MSAEFRYGPAEFLGGVPHREAEAARRALEGASGAVRAGAETVQSPPWYTSGAIYATSTDGTPYDPRIRAAFRDATLAQAESWVRAGIDPTVDERLTQTAKPLAIVPRRSGSTTQIGKHVNVTAPASCGTSTS